MPDADTETAAATAAERPRLDRALAERLIDRASTAPSAHNTQPWLPRVAERDGETVIELAVERGRTLPVADPTGRDTLLALGCWAEAAVIAAAAEGVALEIEPLPALGDAAVYVRAERDEPVARLRSSTRGEAAGPAPHTGSGDPLDAGLLDRRLTYRGTMTSAPGVVEAAGRAVPSWMRLERIAPGDVTHFSAIGTADTLRVPGIARELVSWLRLTPEHPRWHVDGLSADTLLIPPAASRLLAPFTRRRKLRDAAIGALRGAGDVWRRALLELHLDAPGDAVQAEHVVLVVEANELDLGSGVELTRVLNAPLGLPPHVVFEAGRALLRVWLVAASRGAAFAPHSEILDSDLAAGELRFRLGLARRDVPLFVAAVGVPEASAPARSRRKPRAADRSAAR